MKLLPTRQFLFLPLGLDDSERILWRLCRQIDKRSDCQQDKKCRSTLHLILLG